MFAAKAGAKHVYGVDMSSIIESTRQIVKDNNLDNRITLIRGKVINQSTATCELLSVG